MWRRTGNVPLTLDALSSGILGTLDCGPAATIDPGATIDCRTTLEPDPGNYAAVIAALLTGPDGIATDGECSVTEVAADGNVYFQLLEENVEIAMTGASVQPLWLGAAVLLPLIGALLVVLRHRRRDEPTA